MLPPALSGTPQDCQYSTKSLISLTHPLHLPVQVILSQHYCLPQNQCVAAGVHVAQRQNSSGLLHLGAASHAGNQQANQVPARQATLSQAERVQGGGCRQGEAVGAADVGSSIGGQHLAAI